MPLRQTRLNMADSFADVFSALRAILARNTGKLTVSEDSPTRYCLQGGLHPKHKTPMPIAWVEVGKSYVSFHHMGVYARPDLLKGISKKLKERMQGKSCFNFTSFDEPLFAELEDLTARAFEAFSKLPFVQ
jgi:hypothetical protein